jgi:Fe-S-cluster containining protein
MINAVPRRLEVASVQQYTQNSPDTERACDMCGACCQTFPVLVSIGDGEREPRIAHEALRVSAWQRSDDWEYQLHPLPFSRGCLFLGDDDRCTVYQSRPSVCRRFAAGSPECQEARARLGIAPLLAEKR